MPPQPFDRRELQRLINRYRRPLAAICAGLAVLIAMSVIRVEGQEPAQTAVNLSGPAVGEVAVPVIVGSSQIASIASGGDYVDILAVPKESIAESSTAATIVARRARVVESGSPGGGFMPASGGMLVVAVDESTALAIADASSWADLSIAVHPAR
jgi:hypothetical protein